MRDRQLRDRDLRLFGIIRERSDGLLEGRELSGTLRGTYNPRTNETRDPGGRILGRGDFLTRLITGR